MMRFRSIRFQVVSVVVMVLAAAAWPGVATAQDAIPEEDPAVFPWYFSPSIGNVHFEGDQELEPGFVTTLRLGYDFNRRWTFETGLLLSPMLDANTDEFSAQDDASMVGVIADGLFHFTRWQRVDPYLAAGFGFTHYSEELVDGDQDELLLRGGGGIMYHFNDVWSARVDFRGMLAGFGENPNANNIIDAGVVWVWGAVIPYDIEATDESDDWDNDGLVNDDEDEYGTSKYNPDTDGDGLKDGPEVHRYKTDPLNPDSDYDLLQDGAEVFDHDTNPLAADTDRGGVTDGHEVLEDSTNPKDGKDDLILYTLNIEFDSDKWIIKERYFAQVDVIALVLRRNPNAKARIEGHADQRKKSVRAYNDRLSERRANAVLEYLAGQGGIDRGRLSSKGYGFSRPLEKNDPISGNEINRRVEIYISGVGDKENLPELPVAGDLAPEDK